MGSVPSNLRRWIARLRHIALKVTGVTATAGGAGSDSMRKRIEWKQRWEHQQKNGGSRLFVAQTKSSIQVNVRDVPLINWKQMDLPALTASHSTAPNQPLFREEWPSWAQEQPQFSAGWLFTLGGVAAPSTTELSTRNVQAYVDFERVINVLDSALLPISICPYRRRPHIPVLTTQRSRIWASQKPSACMLLLNSSKYLTPNHRINIDRGPTAIAL